MNLFEVLSRGASRLHEPSMSAFLGYLLDSNHDHGLADSFVRAFLTYLDEEKFSEVLRHPSIDCRCELESVYESELGRRVIDIELSIMNENEEVFRLLIENKIRLGAANARQLADYYSAILQDDPKIKNLYIVFLTPESKSSGLSAEFNQLVMSAKQNHTKRWIHWDSKDGEGVLPLLRSLLAAEASGEINPINEYMRHTLKAFIRHVSLTANGSPLKTMRTGEDIGEISEETTIRLADGSSYRVVRRTSTQIQVFNEETGEKEIARRILARFIDENDLAIPYHQLNTRTIGKKFFDATRGEA